MNKKRKKVLICGNYGIGNLGDEAILAGIIRLIQSAQPHSEMTVFSANPTQTSDYFKLKAIWHFPAGIRSNLKFWIFGRFLSTIMSVWQADLIILGGGGLFADEKKSAVWIWFVQAFWFYLLRKKVVCLAQSVGPLHGKSAQKMASWVFKKAVAVTVRDSQSKILLEKLKVKNVQLIADPAYAIGYDIDSFHKRADYVVLTLRPWMKGDQKKIDLELAKVIDWLWLKHALKTLFVPFQTDMESDLSRYEALKNLIEKPQALEVVKEKIDYKEAVKLIARARLCLGMRLHSIIFAVLTKTPFWAFSYSKKVKDFVQTLGMDSYIDYEMINADLIKADLEALLLNTASIEKELEKQKLFFVYEVFKHEQILKKFLE